MTEDSPSVVSCHVFVGNENNETITWTWKFRNQTIQQNACAANIISNNTQSSLVFAETPLIGNGVYQCTASNKFGSFTRTVHLRVQSIFFYYL